MYGNRLERAIELAKELQEVLGQIHDFAVLMGLLNIHRIHLVKGCQQIVADLGDLKERLVPAVAPAYDSFLLELGSILTEGSRSSKSSPAPNKTKAYSQDSASHFQKPRVIVSARKPLDLSTSTENGNLKGRVM